MKAQQQYRYRARQGDVIVDRVIWAWPAPTPDRQHGLKYRRPGGRQGHGIVRSDHETGTGDHRQDGEPEAPYRFISLDRRIADVRHDGTHLGVGAGDEPN